MTKQRCNTLVWAGALVATLLACSADPGSSPLASPAVDRGAGATSAFDADPPSPLASNPWAPSTSDDPDASAAPDEPFPDEPSTETLDSEDPPDGGAPDAGVDEASDSGPSLPDATCASSLAAGDLIVDELMIESVAGAGDYGEWLEVRSTRLDAICLKGLHGECPKGAKVVTFDVSEPVWLPPGGTFLVADSTDPAINHGLSGLVFGWFGRPGDVLRNKGATVTLSWNGTVIEAITYPALALSPGASVAFPADCDLSRRGDFSNWSASSASFFPGFLGTPNAPNDDVHCGVD